MKTTCLIEIKDNKIVSTISIFSNKKWNILFQKEYFCTKIGHETLLKIKNDYAQIMKEDILDKIKINILINTKNVEIKSIDKNFNKKEKYDKYCNFLKETITKHYSKKYLIGISQGNITDKPFQLTKKIWYTYEMIDKRTLNNIINKFTNSDFEIIKIIPLHKSVNNSVEQFSNVNDKIINITLEEGYSLWSHYIDGKPQQIHTINKGINLIYNEIHKYFDITYLEAKNLMNKFGSIPPNKVVDNKIIHTKINPNGTVTTYSKKDLSIIITSSINNIFSYVKNELKNNKTNILFSGYVTNIYGFEEYALNEFSENKLLIFENDIIGLNESSSFITTGALKSIETKKFNMELNTPKKESEKKENIFIIMKSRILNNRKYI